MVGRNEETRVAHAIPTQEIGRSSLNEEKKKGKSRLRKNAQQVTTWHLPPGSVPWIQPLLFYETTAPIGVRQRDFQPKLPWPLCNRWFNDQHPGLIDGATNHTT